MEITLAVLLCVLLLLWNHYYWIPGKIHSKLHPYLVTDNKNFWQIWKKNYTVFCCKEGVLPIYRHVGNKQIWSCKPWVLPIHECYLYSSNYGNRNRYKPPDFIHAKTVTRPVVSFLNQVASGFASAHRSKSAKASGPLQVFTCNYCSCEGVTCERSQAHV